VFRRYALVTADGDALGPVAFVRRDFKPGDIIPHANGQACAS
jgi:hypothetical protein